MNISQATLSRISELCSNKNISLNYLCTNSAVPQSTISEFVQGRTQSITLNTLKKLCDGLDISIADFFDTDTFRNLEQEIK